MTTLGNLLVSGQDEYRQLAIHVHKTLRDLEVPDGQTRIYLSQAMQGMTSANPRTWVPKFKKWAISHQLFCFDPVSYGKYTSSRPSAIVQFDYAVVSVCHLLIIDFTRGLSIGATCEMVEAHRRGIPIIGVVRPRQEVSPWAHYHCAHIVTPKHINEYVLRTLQPNLV